MLSLRMFLEKQLKKSKYFTTTFENIVEKMLNEKWFMSVDKERVIWYSAKQRHKAHTKFMVKKTAEM